MNKSPFCLAALLLCLVALLSPGLPSSFASNLPAAPIRIGEINPLTGKLAKHGQEIHEGILFAVERVNNGGGIGGRQVELASRDDQSLPEIAINQAEDLLYRVKVAGIVGGYVDSLVGPVSELAAKHRTPYVASASLQRALTRGRENPYFFRVSRLDGVVRPLCGFVTEMVHPRRVAILFAATPGSSEFAAEVKKCLEETGIAVVLFEKFRPGSPDFTPFLLKVRLSGAEVVISGGFFPDHLILARQILEQKMELRAYIGPWGVAYPAFIQEMGAASEGLFGMAAWTAEITMPGTGKQSLDFDREFTRRFGKTPNTTTMHGYTSARALLAAIEGAVGKGLDPSGENISRELRALDLVLPMERLAFDRWGDPKHYGQVVVRIEKGKMVPVYPPERAATGVKQE